MAGKVFGKELHSKRVVSVDGADLGVLADVVVDVKTGAMVDLVVKPDINLDTSDFRSEGGHVLIASDAVRSVKDNVIVETKK
ncbi:MAG: PRC-barrel domain-containing protein [Halobacteria archaeon]